MTSTNHFRGRKLSRSLVAPVSPRVNVTQHVPDAPTIYIAHVDGQIANDQGANSSSRTWSNQALTYIGSDNYEINGNDDQGQPCTLRVKIIAGTCTAQYKPWFHLDFADCCHLAWTAFTPPPPFTSNTPNWIPVGGDTVLGALQLFITA